MNAYREEAIDIGKGLLGMALRYDDGPDYLIEHTRPSDFPRELDELVEAVYRLSLAGLSVDVQNTLAELRSDGCERFAANDLVGIYELALAPALGSKQAARMRELAGVQQLERAVHDFQARAAGGILKDGELSELQQLLADGIDRSRTEGKGKFVSWSKATALLRERYMEARKDIPPEMLAHGVGPLSKYVPGFRPGELIVIGARSGVGKSTFAMQALVHACKSHSGYLGRKPRGVVVSLEMSPLELRQRTFAAEHGVPLDWLEDPSHNLNKELDTKVMRWLSDESEGPSIEIGGCRADSRSDLSSIGAIEEELRMMHRRERCDIALVDYAALVRGTGRDRREKVISVVEGLNNVAKALGIPILLASQLNNNGQNDNERPKVGDLSESSALHHSANVVLLLHRKLHPNPSRGEESESGGTIANGQGLGERIPRATEAPEGIEPFEVIVGKNRHGGLGRVDCAADFRCFRIGSSIRELVSGRAPTGVAMGPQRNHELRATPRVEDVPQETKQ